MISRCTPTPPPSPSVITDQSPSTGFPLTIPAASDNCHLAVLSAGEQSCEASSVVSLQPTNNTAVTSIGSIRCADWQAEDHVTPAEGIICGSGTKADYPHPADAASAIAMGNEQSTKKLGSSSRQKVYIFDGKEHTPETIRQLLEDYRSQLASKSGQVEKMEEELRTAKLTIADRDQQLALLREEVDKLRSVLTQTTRRQQLEDVTEEEEGQRVPVPEPAIKKKQGVSGESVQQAGPVDLKYHEKDAKSRHQIRDAIKANDFLSHLNTGQVSEMVSCMYEREIPAGSHIIREGDIGQHLYVGACGEFEVWKSDKLLGKMASGRCFGELALLYNCNRTASVKALCDAKVWALDRRVFQTIMLKTGLQRQEELLSFMRSVPLLQNLPPGQLSKIADVLEIQYHAPGSCIIRQGESADSFFIIQSGKVRVTQRTPGQESEIDIRQMEAGDYFGEKALLSEGKRTATVYALEPGVEVLYLYRNHFLELIGNMKELQSKDYGDEKRLSELSNSMRASQHQQLSPYRHLKFTDIEFVATLGLGGFGRVELVTLASDKSKAFALKCLKKCHIVQTRQQEHVLSERRLLLEVNSAFVCKLYTTFRDNKYVYMLLEVCLGGELWTLLRDKSYFDEPLTRFCLGCVIEALGYLHGHGIIYRDLKPENLLVDSAGFIKLCDFGFAKRLGSGRKTWTFCGTPEYVAPEVILNKGHDFSADYWSLGILTYELSTGLPPFSANDPMKIYTLILKGIDSIDLTHNRRINPQRVGEFIRKLCRTNPAERLGNGKLGFEEIRGHKFFQGFDWEGLSKHAFTSPLKMRINGPIDHSNFDTFPRDTTVPPEEMSGWDADFDTQ